METVYNTIFYFFRPGEAVEISGPTTSLITPQNWQPPAPIFPHMGHVSLINIILIVLIWNEALILAFLLFSSAFLFLQMISTPIGPTSNVPLPVYAGFAALPQHTSSPGAQFFYQDMVTNALFPY